MLISSQPPTARAPAAPLGTILDQHARLAAKRAPRLRPHCLGELPGHDHTAGGRCATCRLHVGAARSTAANTATGGPRPGAAAGPLVARARREAPGEVGDPYAVTRDIRRVAAALGVRADRLRMLDYQCAWVEDQGLCPLSRVLASFESWKAAHQAALATA
ncbi:MAG: hypothetical protein WKF96_21260 [Solirubrobacteraceae bacterium]